MTDPTPADLTWDIDTIEEQKAEIERLKLALSGRTQSSDHPGLTCAEAQELIDHYREHANETSRVDRSRFPAWLLRFITNLGRPGTVHHYDGPGTTHNQPRAGAGVVYHYDHGGTAIHIHPDHDHRDPRYNHFPAHYRPTLIYDPHNFPPDNRHDDDDA